VLELSIVAAFCKNNYNYFSKVDDVWEAEKCILPPTARELWGAAISKAMLRIIILTYVS